VTSDFVRHRLPPLDWSQPQAERAFSLPYQMSEDP
jgi:hypothetical protein